LNSRRITVRFTMITGVCRPHRRSASTSAGTEPAAHRLQVVVADGREMRVSGLPRISSGERPGGTNEPSVSMIRQRAGIV
jgi:hypothetical protein